MSDDFSSDPLDEDDFGDFPDPTADAVPDNLTDDVLAEFDEEDFDEDFDDDFEEEIEGEYALEDDKYGAEFHEEFGHLEESEAVNLDEDLTDDLDD